MYNKGGSILITKKLEDYSNILENLNKFPILGAFSKDEVIEFLSYVEIKEFEKGEKVFAQGDSPEAIYLIERGKIQLEYNLEDNTYNLKSYNEGDCFGQMALLGIKPYLATAICVEGTALLSLSKFAFHSLSKKNIKLFSKLLLNITREVCRYNYYLTEYLGDYLKK